MSTVETRAEQPLSGKVFLLTGASRGIGAATALELARRGARVIGPHRDPGKNSRAESVVRQVEAIGGTMIAPVADVTKHDQRTILLSQIERDFGKIDGIIFNHAGGLERDLMEADPQYHLQVNGYSKRDLFQEAQAAGVLADRAVVVDVPSLWSRFQHTDIPQLPAYDPVAQGKKLGEKLLRAATRTYNRLNGLGGKEVKFGSVCGHAIGDTATVKLLGRMDKEAMAEVERTAEGGKLPTIADMANAIATMAGSNFENEEVLYVGPPQIKKTEMPNALPMYNTDTRYVDSLVMFDQGRAYGFYRVSEEDTGSELPGNTQVTYLDQDPAIALIALTVDDNDTAGHFTSDFGISVLPGHKVIRAAAIVASANLAERIPYEFNPRFAGVSGPIEFKVPVQPGDRLLVEVESADGATEERTDVSVKIGQTEVASVAGLKFESTDPIRVDGDGISLDRLIEAAAQTLGLAFLHTKDVREVLPLFAGVKGPIVYNKEVLPGQLLEMEAVLNKGDGTKQFSGDVYIRVDDEVVAQVLGIDCRLFPVRGLERVIRLGRRNLE